MHHDLLIGRISSHVATAALLVAACGELVPLPEHAGSDDTVADAASDPPPTPGDDDTRGEPAPEGSDGSDAETSSTGAAPDTTGEESSRGDDDDDWTGGCAFLCAPDGGGPAIECDVWAQDCPVGEKCMPWANDGGSSWNATRCTPIAADPGQPGDSCLVEGSGLSGIDDCALGSMCWDVNEQNMGTCVAFCGGSEAAPTCEDQATGCAISNEGTLVLCLPICDPLLQDCIAGQGCYPVNDGFFCTPDVSDSTGGYGDACWYLNSCDPGLFCAAAQAVPGCADIGCCSPFCDLADPTASASCPGAAAGQECVPWFEEDQTPPGDELVGACAVPA